ncbi:uncharacterized protein BDZ83DRAFT_607919 [Colletotrichum acutatum]|uniref:Uncharacterized protein n=1 Tax=Glomerella acutata TaxID=27357 RepID=A0AAD8UVT8_GLOAC|nr:uncharacterized protein BDZ83DRAFT_607919 [Colletotrichum acutatum]KAK1728723.1 hypothetical protein BDZ83DRAFT_607919 [Colletotrichum acutatum]
MVNQKAERSVTGIRKWRGRMIQRSGSTDTLADHRGNISFLCFSAMGFISNQSRIQERKKKRLGEMQ